MNQVDISPETVEREYAQIAVKYKLVAANDDAFDEDGAPEQVPETMQPERIASPETLSRMQEVDIELATLEKWKDDPEVTPELLRHGVVATNQSVSKLSKMAVRKMVGLTACDDAIDEFVEALSPVIMHHYPKGGLPQFLSENGMYISLAFAAWGLGGKIMEEYTAKQQATEQGPTQEHQEDAA